MLGAIAGDVIGSVHEAAGTKTTRFPLFTPESRFTDDTVLTVAVADALLHGLDFVDAFHEHFNRHPRAGYGGSFIRWARAGSREPYGSWGNGSAMRVSPVGFAFKTLEETLDWAARSAAVTHDHPEGIKGAEATAAAIFLARNGADKPSIQREITARFGYSLDEPLASIRPNYEFDVSCKGSVPQAIRAFLESRDLEEAIRLAISLGGDADTQAAIAGGIAEAFHGGVPEALATPVRLRLDERQLAILDAFRLRWPHPAVALD